MIQVQKISSPKSSENTNQKKKSSPKIGVFLSTKLSEDQKKGLHRNLELYSAGICGIYSCWQVLFHLIILRSNLDGGPGAYLGGHGPPLWIARIV